MAHAQSVEDLQHMSLDELANIDVSSVSKTTESLSAAPAAIFVITHADIVRSGASSLPEILRLAPNLQIAQTSASKYEITARGFSGSAESQNFSNKLLVLIDGRAVYSPLYSGVYWDIQDVVPEDIDRIEVISGPGATLWGANAVNGVINIITRKSDETQGGLAQAVVGDQRRTASLRYGGRIGDAVSYRIYGRTTQDDDTRTAAGANAGDHWDKLQGGFRLDWAASPRDSLTFQGDAYDGEEALGGGTERIGGHNLLARWTRAAEGGARLQAQAFYDRTTRELATGGGFELQTWDVDVQHGFTLGRRHEIVWGGGVRLNRYDIEGTASIYFKPSGRTLTQSNLFVQDSIAVTDKVKLILGLKVEDDPYSGVVALPNARLSWKPNDRTLLWAAASRAIRSPTPFDRDVQEVLGGGLFLVGGLNFQPETLNAYEFGVRLQATSRASLSISTYYNDYDDLRSIEFDPVTLIPLHWGNGMRGHTYGLEAWGDYRATDWWRLSAGLNLLEKRLSFKPGSSGLLGLAQAGDDPGHQVFLKSSMNLGSRVTLDADLRHIGKLPAPRVAAYTEMNARLGWKVTDRVELAIAGRNLLHERHQEFPAPGANTVPRSVSVDLTWRF